MISKYYQFPKITEKMYEKISYWHQTHNDGKCVKRYSGAIGGRVSFMITPTSMGDFIEVKCSCGETLNFDTV